MKGIEFDPLGRITIVEGMRTVTTTDGTLVCLLSSLQTFDDVTLDYADPPKSEVRPWTGHQEWTADISTDHYLQRQTIQHFYCRSPQELETYVELMDAPDGADIFVGHVRLERTTSPTHNWWGQPLVALQPQNVWVPWNGSGMMEHAYGVTRLLHLEIAYPDDVSRIARINGKLRLALQQSVGPKVGGAGTQSGIQPPNQLFRRRTEGNSYVLQDFNNAGVLVWTSSSSPYRAQKSNTFSGGLTVFVPQFDDWHPTLGTYPAAADPTNYRSVYSVDVRGYFGRRS